MISTFNHRVLYNNILNSRGFTLIEILVVMILIAVSGSLIFLNVGRSVEKKQGKLFAQEIVGFVKKARRESLERSMPVAFYISSVSRFCWIEGSQSKLDIPEKIQIQSKGITNFDNDIHGIYFFPDGSSSGGELTLVMNGRPYFAFRVDILTSVINPG
jgi:general secretion pathway protein H